MTKTHQLLNLMASGKPVTYADITACTGWTHAQAQKVVHFTMTAGYIRPLTHEYAITPAGIERQKFTPKRQQLEPKTDADKMARIAETRRMRRETSVLRRHAAERESQASKTETMVQTSVRTNANSVFKLGDRS